MNPQLLHSFAGKKNEIDRYRPLSQGLVARLRDEFMLEWTYNSNAIEGNTLTLRETELVVKRGLTIGGKPLREHFEALNHAEAIAYIYDFCRKKKPVSEEFVRHLHELILKNIDTENAGSYRRNNVRIMGATHVPPDARKIPGLMNDFITWFHSQATTLEPPRLAAIAHYQLVHIHPFLDGNGRTARLLMNAILIRHGYPPAVIAHLDRKKYYRVLSDADRGRMEAFEDFIGKAIERSLIIYLNALAPQKKSEKQGYITLAQAARQSIYSQEYLSLLARKGFLPAVKFGRNWMTTSEALDEYTRDTARK